MSYVMINRFIYFGYELEVESYIKNPKSEKEEQEGNCPFYALVHFRPIPPFFYSTYGEVRREYICILSLTEW